MSLPVRFCRLHNLKDKCRHFLRCDGSHSIKIENHEIAQWSASLAVPPETLGSRPGSVAAGRDTEVRGATHYWPSVVRVRDGLAGREIIALSRAGRSARQPMCTVFPPTHWCSWLPGWMRAVLKKCDLGSVSPEHVRELQP
jgi:hypothetical protein